MQPIGPLMIEHRLIERMIVIMEQKSEIATRQGIIDTSFIETAADFVRIYADRTHHGKEEDILFRDLATKKLSAEDQRVMNELVEEHKLGRRMVGELVSATEDYKNGNVGALNMIIEKLRFLVKFYPEHIAKEDKQFFPASMKYFNEKERDLMLEEMWEFDRNMIHEKYKAVVNSFK